MFAKSGCNHCILLQHLVREARGRAERKSVVTSMRVLLLGTTALSLPAATACCRAHAAQMEAASTQESLHRNTSLAVL